LQETFLSGKIGVPQRVHVGWGRLRACQANNRIVAELLDLVLA